VDRPGSQEPGARAVQLCGSYDLWQPYLIVAPAPLILALPFQLRVSGEGKLLEGPEERSFAP
jgi:hypothetical protein